MSKYCDDCGLLNSEDALVCTGCGYDFNSGANRAAGGASTGGASGGAQDAKLINRRYKIIGEVKSGAMGCVYEAQDTNLDITVALKKLIVSQDCDEFEEAKRTFRREAAILSNLNHPGLPHVTDFFTDIDPETGHSACWLVMSYIDGEDLETMFNRNAPPYSKKWVVKFAISILKILNYLHSQNPPIIYRDIKPSNIVIADSNIYLVDFGIARTLDPNHKGTQIGTPGYAPPEQYKGYTDERSDIYSLGVLMHYLLTGKNPDNNPDLFTFKSIYKINPDLGFEISDLVESMVNVVPDKRPKNVKIIMDCLLGNTTLSTIQASAGAVAPVSNKDGELKTVIIVGFVIMTFVSVFFSSLQVNQDDPKKMHFPQSTEAVVTHTIIPDKPTKSFAGTDSGADSFSGKNKDGKIEQYTDEINKGNKDYNLLFKRGLLYLKAGKNAEAAKDFRTVTGYKPDCTEAYYNLALAEKDANPQQAVEILSKALFKSPDNRQLLELRGDIYKSLDKYDEADKDYDRVFRKISDKSVYPSKLAETAFLRKDYQKALEFIDKAIEIKPSVPDYHSLKAKILLASGKTREAEASLKKANFLLAR